jgi:hypothetical protein
VLLSIASAALMGGALHPTVENERVTPPYIFTNAARYQPAAWRDGHDRFPGGATLGLVDGGTRRALVPDFHAAADATVSVEARRVLLPGKFNEGDHSLRPACVLAAGRLYPRSGRVGPDMEVAGTSVRLTFAPGRLPTDEVLRDAYFDGENPARAVTTGLGLIFRERTSGWRPPKV